MTNNKHDLCWPKSEPLILFLILTFVLSSVINHFEQNKWISEKFDNKNIIFIEINVVCLYSSSLWIPILSSFEDYLKTLQNFDPAKYDVPDHHEGEPEEQSQGSADLGKEGLEGINWNFLQNLNTVRGEGKSNQRKSVKMCLAVENVLKVKE